MTERGPFRFGPVELAPGLNPGGLVLHLYSPEWRLLDVELAGQPGRGLAVVAPDACHVIAYSGDTGRRVIES